MDLSCVKGKVFSEVTTELGSSLFDDEPFYFHNYYSADCWIIAEVFNNRARGNFHLNEVIEMQLDAAKITSRTPSLVVLKNVVHKPLFTIWNGEEEVRALVREKALVADVPKTLEVIRTPLVSGIFRVVRGRILDVEWPKHGGELHMVLTFSTLG